MAAIYTIFSSPTHPPVPNHLPTLIVTPHGQPSNVLYSYLHTNFNTENYLLTPSPGGDLCVAKLFPPPRQNPNKPSSASDPGHGSSSPARVVRCEASRNLKWSIANTGVISPIYKLSLPSPDSPDLPLFQISKPNPNANFWSMFYFAYAGHLIPPKRIEFGKIQKNPPGPGGGGTRISITGKTPEEKAVWQTLGEGNEDCVEWVVLCAALNLLDDEIVKAAGGTAAAGSSNTSVNKTGGAAASSPTPGATSGSRPPQPTPQKSSTLPPQGTPRGQPPAQNGTPLQQPVKGPPAAGFAPPNGPPPQAAGQRGPPPAGYDGRGPPPGPGGPPGSVPRGPPPPAGFDGRGPPSGPGGQPPPSGPGFDPRRGPPPNGAGMNGAPYDPRRGPPPQTQQPPARRI